MRVRRHVWHLLGGVSVGLLATFALLSAGAATASSGSAVASVATYGPTRDWGGTQIRSMDPTPCVTPGVPPGCTSGGSGGSGGGSGGSSGSSSSTSSTSTHNASKSSLPPDRILSNEFTFTRYAYVTHLYKIHRRPTNHSRVITRLHRYTESGFPEIYLLLRSHWVTSRRQWIKVRIPGRPNGRVGWVLRQGLSRFHVTHQLLVVNTEQLRMDLYAKGRRVWSAPVGVGKPSTPTPHGHFWITERFVITDPSSGYYPFAFGTTDYSTLTEWPQGGVVGVHGPFGAAWRAIPGRISHGCIRLHRPDDAWLGNHLQLGTPLHVI